MKDSEIYLKAAELVADERTEFSCIAISVISDASGAEYHCKQRDEFAKLFSATESKLHAGNVHALPDSIGWRVLALCFMSAIAKDEGK